MSLCSTSPKLLLSGLPTTSTLAMIIFQSLSSLAYVLYATWVRTPPPWITRQVCFYSGRAISLLGWENPGKFLALPSNYIHHLTISTMSLANTQLEPPSLPFRLLWLSLNLPSCFHPYHIAISKFIFNILAKVIL